MSQEEQQKLQKFHYRVNLLWQL